LGSNEPPSRTPEPVRVKHLQTHPDNYLHRINNGLALQHTSTLTILEMINLDRENYKIFRGYTGKMRENSPTRICIFKNFSGVIPPDPVNKGRGQGKGKERTPLPQFLDPPLGGNVTNVCALYFVCCLRLLSLCPLETESNRPLFCTIGRNIQTKKFISLALCGNTVMALVEIT
jgi:hypothetical protein